MADNRIYLCIDLKSFYASVECVERGLDPMTTNLVVADPERSEKTICLAITPSMKALGIKNRCRVFEIPKNVKYITAPPRMQKYIDYAAEIYAIYLKYLSKDDIYVYSIDEAFMDVTTYLSTYKCSAKELAVRIMDDVHKNTGVRATCGIGTNLYLTKIALDITAKHSPDFIGYLDEKTFIETLWEHTPLTDFWRIGRGTAKRLNKYGITTMKDIANANEDVLYKEFGIDAELMIDHAWGKEPVSMADIKAYKPKVSSITSGQVLMHDYTFDEGRIIIREMTELLCLELVKKKMVTSSVTLYVGYSNALKAEPARGTASLTDKTNSDSVIIPAVVKAYERAVNPQMEIKRVNISFNNLKPEGEAEQISMFDTRETEQKKKDDLNRQKTINSLKTRFGKNAVFRGTDLQDGATTLERNRQIGGHKSGE